MKKNIHPEYFKDAKITCACGNKFSTGSTKKEIRIELCNQCHPFYTGKQKFVDTARRVEKFEERAKKQAAAAAGRKGKKVKKAAAQAKKAKEEAKNKPKQAKKEKPTTKQATAKTAKEVATESPAPTKSSKKGTKIENIEK